MGLQEDIRASNVEMLNRIRSFSGAHVTPDLEKQLGAAFFGVSQNAGTDLAIQAMNDGHAASIRIATAAVGRPLTPAEQDSLLGQWRRIQEYVPGGGGGIVGAIQDFANWDKNATSTAGRALAAASNAIGEGIGDVADLASHIPIIGGLLHGVLGIVSGPFTFTASMLEGERIDHALLDDLRSKVTAYQEIAPYAATIVSFVPGIGSGVAGAIAASTALMQGMPIDKAVMAGVRGALPGGAAARAAFDLSVAAVSGDNIISAGGDALIEAAGLPPQAKNALNVIYRASKGENIPKAVLENAYSLMPSDETRQAMQAAVAVAYGKKLQDAVKEQLSNLTVSQVDKLRNIGAQYVAATPLYQNTVKLLESANPQQLQKSVSKGFELSLSATPSGVRAGYNLTSAVTGINPVREGFNLGIGLVSHVGVTKEAIDGLRKKLTPQQLKGFDAALSTHIAAVVAPAMPEPSPATVNYYLGKTRDAAVLADKVDYFLRAGTATDYIDRERQAQADYYLKAQTPAAQAGYFLTFGLRGHPSSNMKAALVKDVSSDPEGRAGAALALTVIGAQNPSLWSRIKRFFGIGR